jgi:hypothetical protein
MKTLRSNRKWCITALSVAALVVGFVSSALRVQAQTSPGGTWDLVLSGNQLGVAQITFDDDNFTLVGNEIITVKHRSSSSSGNDNPRGGPDDASRGDTDSGSSTNLGNNVYGSVGLSGYWTYDSRGRVIGVIVEDGGTNGFTNGISFRAVVKRRSASTNMTMTAVRDGRSITYSGVPLQTLPDISGDYYGTGKKAGLPFTELFTLAPFSLPNTYQVSGIGPNYDYTGYAMLSAKKKLAFVSFIGDPTNSLLRSVFGPYTPSKGTASLKGVMEKGAGEENVSLNISQQPD